MNMNPQTHGQPRESFAEIDLFDVVCDITGAWRTIAVAMLGGAIIAALALSSSPRVYTATAVVGPAEGSAQGGLGSSLGQFSGAASLLGVNLGSSGGTDFVEFGQLLTSERLAKKLYQNEALRPVFFGTMWRPETKSWVQPRSLKDTIRRTVMSPFGSTNWTPPNSFDLQDTIESKLTILEDKVTNYVTLTFQSDTPEHAEYGLSTIIRTTDEEIRQASKDRAAGRIAFLNTTLRQTTIQDQRDAIISVLSSQEKTMMMASVDKTYAINLIDPPSAGPAPTSPRPLASIIGAVFAALLLSSLFIAARGYFLVRSAAGRARGREPSLDRAIWNSLTRRRARA
jgi:uncharacterized protein involved in exopolysaccharide biosynthesis